MELQTNVDKKRGALLTLGLHGCFFFIETQLQLGPAITGLLLE